MLKAAALASVGIPVEANWAVAVFVEARAGSGVEVLAVCAFIWAAEAAASEHVEVLVGRTRIRGVLDAGALAVFMVPSGVEESAIA